MSYDRNLLLTTSNSTIEGGGKIQSKTKGTYLLTFNERF